MIQSKAKIRVVVLLLIVSFFVALSYNGPVTAHGAEKTIEFDAQNYTLSHLTATDAMDRTLPEISGYKQDRYVGLFYFLWFGSNNDVVRNMTELLKTETLDEIFSLTSERIPPWSVIYFNEPLYGYYNSMDEWVMRKHIEQFIMAGIDYLMIDYTNNIYYKKPLERLLDLLVEYTEAGWNTPKITFYVNLEPQKCTQRIYEEVYLNEKYKDIVFYGKSTKPIIVSVPGELSDELNNYFDVRVSQFHQDSYPKEDIWFYMEGKRPPSLCTDVMNVSVAQMNNCAFGNAFKGPFGKNTDSFGRGYSSKSPVNHKADAILCGDNFQEEWNHAIQIDPDMVFVTGWNEWFVQKICYTNPDGTYMYDVATFWDTFNTEYSRDVEMTKTPTYVVGEDGEYIAEGYGDNFYLQLAANIRRYKGIANSKDVFEAPSSVSVDLSGPLSQWDAVTERYIAISTVKMKRSYRGYFKGTDYKQAEPDNFIKEVKVTYDKDNVYFLITTDENITAHQAGKTNWMNLFIGVEDFDAPAWENFQYVLNRNPVSNTETSIERFTIEDSYETESAGTVQYRVDGKTMQIAVPRSTIGIETEI